MGLDMERWFVLPLLFGNGRFGRLANAGLFPRDEFGFDLVDEGHW